MQNLLSQEEKYELRKGYRKRLLIVFSWVIFFSFLISIVVFVPDFSMAFIKMGDINRKIETNSDAIKEQNDVLMLPEDINEKVKIIYGFKNKSLSSQEIENVVSTKSPGIALDGVSYKKNEKADASRTTYQILMSGTATDREALLAFQKVLQKMDFVQGISIPVSSFTKDNDLPFTVTVTLATN